MRVNVRRPIWLCLTRCHVPCCAWLRAARSLFFEHSAMWFAIIGAIPLHSFRLLARASTLAANRWDTLHQVHQLCDVMPISSGQGSREWDALSLDQQMMLAPQFAPIRGVFADFLAPVTRSHTGTVNDTPLPIKLPLGLKLRENALPQPTPNAPLIPFEESAATGMPEGKSPVAGRDFHGTPVLRTKMMPVITLRASVGFLPACWMLRRFFVFGSSGSMRCHNCSERIEFDIRLTPLHDSILYLILFPL